MTQQPTFGDLSLEECEALLALQHVGRMAFTFHDKVDVEPLHFVYRDGVIWGRTQPGSKVSVLVRHPWVAFEVDEVQSLFSWRSVVVHGRVEFPNPDGAPMEQAQYAAGVEVFQSLIPTAFTERDPTPERSLLFRLPVAEMTGRFGREVRA
jgi:uncharacterized protein